MSANAIDVMRTLLKSAHDTLEGTVADVTAESCAYQPSGRPSPIGAQYGHVAVTEDFFMNQVLQGATPLLAAKFAGKTGLSEPPPAGGVWDEWGRRVRVDLSALREYASGVYAASDEYLASLTPDDLARKVDLTFAGFGEQTVGFVLGIMIAHPSWHTGEISAIKGLQGHKGYPF